MARLVKIPRLVSSLTLPNGATYTGPVQVVLTDAEFGGIPQAYFTGGLVVDLGPPRHGFQILADKGVPSGYAPLDVYGDVPLDHLKGMAEGAVTGTTLGTTALVDGAPVITLKTIWGINALGPYYNPAGVVGAEQAILKVADDGQLFLVSPDSGFV